MVMGTLGSRALRKRPSGMVKGTSKCGGGIACGSVGGGKLKRDPEGDSKKTDEGDMARDVEVCVETKRSG
jgi:hypothetical protein